jgi:hypothetical protein
VTITKAISIVCDNTQAGIGVSGFADGVDITAGANDVITLKGLDIEGLGSAFAGINFQSGAALHVHKVHVRNFRNSGSSSGLIFQPATYAELYVADSTFSDNGTTAIGGGILIAPVGSGSVNVSINRVRLENNFSGILVDGTHTTGVAVNATVLDSGIAGSQSHGVLAQSTAGHHTGSAGALRRVCVTPVTHSSIT